MSEEDDKSQQSQGVLAPAPQPAAISEGERKGEKIGVDQITFSNSWDVRDACKRRREESIDGHIPFGPRQFTHFSL